MSDGATNGKSKAWKDRAIDWTYITAMLVVMSYANREMIFPEILGETRAIAREEMEVRMNLHERQVDERMQLLHHRLDTLATRDGVNAVEARLEGSFRSVDGRLKDIDERLKHLERSGK